MIAIRPFMPHDYDGLTVVFNAAYSDADATPIMPTSAGDLRDDEANDPPHVVRRRWVVERDGQIVGAGEYSHIAHRFHPRRYWLDVYVHPEYQRRGIGSALYNHVIADLTQRDPLGARCAIREDVAHSVRFAEGRGWVEMQRTWESYLDLASFDWTPYVDVQARVADQGVVIRTLPELSSDRDRDRKLYNLTWAIRQDFPEIDAPTREPFDEFCQNLREAKKIVPDAYFVALRDNEYIGLATHKLLADMPNTLLIGSVGVVRHERRKGIALALKLRGMEYARQHAFVQLRTTNVSTNRAILAINERMGFQKRPAWIDIVKTFAVEE